MACLAFEIASINLPMVELTQAKEGMLSKIVMPCAVLFQMPATGMMYSGQPVMGSVPMMVSISVLVT